MCWNPEVSLRTFLIAAVASTAALQQGILTAKDVTFFMTFASMQLVEFFLWIYLNNRDLNTLFSAIGLFLIILEPYFAIKFLPSEFEKNQMTKLYLFCVMLYLLWQTSVGWDLKTTIGENGHLKWDWLPSSWIVWCLFAFFLIYPIWAAGNYIGAIMTLSVLLYSIYNYHNYGTAGTMWCWVSAMIVALYTISTVIVSLVKKHNIA